MMAWMRRLPHSSPPPNRIRRSLVHPFASLLHVIFSLSTAACGQAPSMHNLSNTAAAAAS